jgi:hypothetical protein
VFGSAFHLLVGLPNLQGVVERGSTVFGSGVQNVSINPAGFLQADIRHQTLDFRWKMFSKNTIFLRVNIWCPSPAWIPRFLVQPFSVQLSTSL